MSLRLSMAIGCLVGVVGTALPVVEAAEHNQPPEGFTALFNGRDLEGWHGQPHFDPRKLAAMSEEERAKQIGTWTEDAKKHWYVENGELVNDGKGAYLTTDRDYGDIELLIDYKTVAKADSGIYLRGTPQVQIWDTTKEGGKWDRNADKGSGGLFNNTKGQPGQLPLVHADKPFGEWNRFRIIQVGARTWVWLNDKLVVDGAVMENYWDRKTPLFASGPIQLQTHGGEIRWRNVFVREIGAEEANERLAKLDNDGFKSIFNGRDLTGWQGATDAYQVADGAIVCKPGAGGTLFTNDTYSDFVARLEFKLPEGGNNGLAIRYPGEGHPHLDGMCEIQVIDSEHPKYAKLDPRQYHGSAYGIAPAHRGFLRPTGTWNYQEVTVRGPHVRVELNGSVILDADLSQVKEFMGNNKHPGLKLTSGHFGFAGHADPVKFRNIEVKELSGSDKNASAQQAWPQFRGPGGNARPAGDHRYPAEIGPDKNVIWKVALPAGHGSPVLDGERIYLPAQRDDKLFTVCLDRETGKTLWEVEAPHRGLEEIHRIGSHAQSTPVTDGERVVSFFGSCGMFCYDTAGKLLWHVPMGPFTNDFGAASSPIIVGDSVILCQDHDIGSFLAAYDKHTGKLLWKTDRTEFPRNYCTPYVYEVAGKPQIVVAATLRAIGYDAADGRELWTVRGLSRVVCSSPVAGPDGTLYVAAWAAGGDAGERVSLEPFADALAKFDKNNNRTLERSELVKGDNVERRYPQIDRDKSETITQEEYEFYRNLFDQSRNVTLAMRPQGTGDVTEKSVLWQYDRFVPFVASPVWVDDHLFTIKDGGILTCLDAKSGKPLKTARVPGTGSYYASPVAADGKVYLCNQGGEVTVVEATGKWSVLAEADFGEDIYATPALVDGRIYLRTAGHLYCLGEK